MSANDLKREIKKAIDSIPEDMRENVLAYLKNVIAVAPENIQDSRHLHKILLGDRELLEKLAQ